MVSSHLCPRCGRAVAGDRADMCPECLRLARVTSPDLRVCEQTTVGEESEPAASTAARRLPEPGQNFGRYYIVRSLGHGGMGAVFQAEEHETGRRLALKVLTRALDSPESRQRFLREGRLAASVNHPNSVYVFGTEEIGDTPVISMELVAGGTLKDRVSKQGPLPAAEAVDAILQVIAGLEAAQAVGVLHRDVKPSNCFVDNEGTVKIGDFGLSRPTVSTGEHLSISGVFLGTPTFASPNNCAATRSTSARISTPSA